MEMFQFKKNFRRLILFISMFPEYSICFYAFKKTDFIFHKPGQDLYAFLFSRKLNVDNKNNYLRKKQQQQCLNNSLSFCWTT